jgi:hypothetical protein
MHTDDELPRNNIRVAVRIRPFNVAQLVEGMVLGPESEKHVYLISRSVCKFDGQLSQSMAIYIYI